MYLDIKDDLKIALEIFHEYTRYLNQHDLCKVAWDPYNEIFRPWVINKYGFRAVAILNDLNSILP